MAELHGEMIGKTIGYRVRHDVKVSAATRIEVLTEALLTRRMQHDPGLEGVGLVIFDEFHERSLDADLGLALSLEVQSINPDLRLLVMSATLDGAKVADVLGNAKIVSSSGRLFPVETIYAPQDDLREVGGAVAAVIRRALREQTGGILAFLPGEAEIRAAERSLRESTLPDGTAIMPLYGSLSFSQQAEAVDPGRSGVRKVVLATAIAETSLTISDVRVVVDCGLSRQPRFDPATGMTRLITTRVSQASAEQRRGRAGRVAPGTCYRLWSEEAQRALLSFTPPEITSADLCPLALDLAAWGNADPAVYAFLDQPPAAAYSNALGLLRLLGAVDREGRITPMGRRMSDIGVHPRLAHMILRGDEMGKGQTACAVAGLLAERDIIRPDRGQPDCDLRLRLMAFDGSDRIGAPIDRAGLSRARENAKAWARQARVRPGHVDPEAAGPLLALAYPERIAQQRGPRGAFRLRTGRGATMASHDALAGEPFLALGAVDQGKDNARIFLAAPLQRSEIEAAFQDQIEEADETGWDNRSEVVSVRRTRRLGSLILEDRPIEEPVASRITTALLLGIRQIGIERLPWNDELRSLQARASFLKRMDGNALDIVDMSDDVLANEVDKWLEPFLSGITRASQFGRIDLKAALEGRLGWQMLKRLNDFAPTHLEVPSGSRLALDYSSGEPVLAVRLQEMFGALTTPTVANGRYAVTLHLLSPARRPVQITRDLAGFWSRSYQDVKKDLKGRYPKHRWPDNPLEALPTARAKRPGERD
jgi:ATP-dependent helicase HrpB